MGAKLEYGGDSNGCNFNPALLLNVKEGMPAFEEETFGPLASVTIAGNEKEAIRLANSTKYGLAGSIWTKDIEKGICSCKDKWRRVRSSLMHS